MTLLVFAMEWINYSAWGFASPLRPWMTSALWQMA